MFKTVVVIRTGLFEKNHRAGERTPTILSTVKEVIQENYLLIQPTLVGVKTFHPYFESRCREAQHSILSHC